MLKKIQIFVVLLCFIFNMGLPAVTFAQSTQTFLNLPEPGKMISLSQKFVPAFVKGISIYPNDPFKFDFIIDTGDSKLSDQQFKEESKRLIQYFMAALTVPEKEDWVNLSPYEKDRIIPQSLGTTEMGRDMLAQDYILKQLTASLIYPEKAMGQEFWNKVYAQAQKQFGTMNIPVNTFNKVWIVPSQAVVWEHNNSAYVVRSHLKVMLEQDYLSLQKHLGVIARSPQGDEAISQRATSTVGSNVIHRVVLPALEREVNEGANFATLRQVFNSAILAAWYKQNLKQSILGQVYANKNKVTGIDVADKQVKQKIYERYLQAFKKGVFNFIKEDEDPVTHQTVPRKYFSGGVTNLAMVTDVEQGDFVQLSAPDQAAIVGTEGAIHKITAQLLTANTNIISDAAMFSESDRKSIATWLDYYSNSARTTDIEIPQALQRIQDIKPEIVIGGNWKMAVKTEQEAKNLVRDIAQDLHLATAFEGKLGVVVTVAPSFVHLSVVKQTINRWGLSGVISLGAQDVSAAEPGAQTGDSSVEQLKDIGVGYVIIGHSERRQKGETNEEINAKVLRALNAGLKVILAIGETKAQRDSKFTESVLYAQLLAGLKDVPPEKLNDLVIAYEPVWSIGTGVTPDSDEIEHAHLFIRAALLKLFDYNIDAAHVPVQYGGSMKPGNAAEILALKNVSGGLIGGAALKAEDFNAILRAADEQVKAEKVDAAMLTPAELQDANYRAEQYIQQSNIQIALELTRSDLRGAYQPVAGILGKETGKETEGRSKGKKYWVLTEDQLQALKEYYSNLSQRFSDSEYVQKAVELLGKKNAGDKLTEKEQSGILRGSIKKTADALAARTRQNVRDKYGIISRRRFVEGISDGVLQAGRAGEVALPTYLESYKKEIENAIDVAIKQKQKMLAYRLENSIYPIIEDGHDDLEGTDAFVDNPDNPPSWFSGSTSVSAYALGVGSLSGLGFIPDEAYAGQFLAHMDNAKDAEEFRQITIEERNRYGAMQSFHLYDPELYALNPDRFIEVLKFKARKKFGDDSPEHLAQLKVAVTVMDRPTERAFISALERMRNNGMSGLKIVLIKAGSIAHGKKAVMHPEQFEAEYGIPYGDEDVILLSRVGPVEAALSLVDAKKFEETGAVGAMRIFSGNMQENPAGGDMQNQDQRYAFSDGFLDNGDNEIKMITGLRQETGDAQKILNGNKLFTTADVSADVKTSTTVIVGSPFLGQPGVARHDDGSLRVSLITASNSEDGKLKFSVVTHIADAAMMADDQAIQVRGELLDIGDKEIFRKYIIGGNGKQTIESFIYDPKASIEGSNIVGKTIVIIELPDGTVHKKEFTGSEVFTAAEDAYRKTYRGPIPRVDRAQASELKLKTWAELGESGNTLTIHYSTGDGKKSIIRVITYNPKNDVTSETETIDLGGDAEVSHQTYPGKGEFNNAMKWVRLKKLMRIPDAAQMAPTPNPEGGINLDSAMMGLQVVRDGHGMPLPLAEQPFKDSDIRGLRPVIIKDVPINLPELLGMKVQSQQN